MEVPIQTLFARIGQLVIENDLLRQQIADLQEQEIRAEANAQPAESVAASD